MRAVESPAAGSGVRIRQQSCPIQIRARGGKRHGQNRFRLSAPPKSLRPMRHADPVPGLDRERSAPDILSLALQGLRLPLRGGGVFRRVASGARSSRGLEFRFDGIETELWILVLTRFLNANRFPLRLKTLLKGTSARKSRWFLSSNPQ